MKFNLKHIISDKYKLDITSMSTKTQLRRERLKAKQTQQQTDDEFLNSLIMENKKSETTPVDTTNTSDTTTPTPTTESTPVSTDGISSTATISQEEMVRRIDEMYAVVKKYSTEHSEFKDLPDKKKLELFRPQYGELMNELPIVTRYMICMGQYSSKALHRVLHKTATMKHPPPDKREKGYMEDQWIRRQADYVQYMWEHYQRRHYNNAERVAVWEHTYRTLKGEFDDFRDMHKETEEKVKEEKKELVGRNFRDLLERLKTGKQNISEDERNFLKNEGSVIIFMALYKNVMAELLEEYPPIKATCVGVGAADANARPTPKITMIETVDAERMHEIDDKYKMPEHRGMDVVLEEEVTDV